jgi:hypothetical protein
MYHNIVFNLFIWSETCCTVLYQKEPILSTSAVLETAPKSTSAPSELSPLHPIIKWFLSRNIVSRKEGSSSVKFKYAAFSLFV